MIFKEKERFKFDNRESYCYVAESINDTDVQVIKNLKWACHSIGEILTPPFTDFFWKKLKGQEKE